MNTILLPEKESWAELCTRPEIPKADLENTVRDIINIVRSESDSALYKYSEKFDGVQLAELKVSSDEISDSVTKVPSELKNAIQMPKRILRLFMHLSLLMSRLSKRPKESDAGERMLQLKK